MTRFLVVFGLFLLVVLAGGNAVVAGLLFVVAAWASGFFGAAGESTFSWLQQRRRERAPSAPAMVWEDAGRGAVVLASPAAGSTIPMSALSGVDKAVSDDKNRNPRL